jgi:hypothetical protein
MIMESWQGPTMLGGGDFNLVRTKKKKVMVLLTLIILVLLMSGLTDGVYIKDPTRAV